MYSKILVPLDGSKTAENVLPYARFLAGKFKVPVELLAVLDIAEMATHISAERARHLDTMIEDGMRASTTYVRGVATTFPDGNVTCTIEKDRAEEAIISRAEADGDTLIAMATHGRSGLNRLLGASPRKYSGSANPMPCAPPKAKTTGEWRSNQSCR
jgi:nucleotide-binding universal stress UspA family protein